MSSNWGYISAVWKNEWKMVPETCFYGIKNEKQGNKKIAPLTYMSTPLINKLIWISPEFTEIPGGATKKTANWVHFPLSFLHNSVSIEDMREKKLYLDIRHHILFTEKSPG